MICCGALMGFIIVHSMKYKAEVSTFLVHDNYGIYCVLASSLILGFIYQHIEDLGYLEIFLILLGNSFGYLAMYLQYIAVKFQKVTLVGIISYTQVVMTYIGEVAFNDLELHLLDVLGGLIIIAAALGLSIYNYILERRGDKEAQQKLLQTKVKKNNRHRDRGTRGSSARSPRTHSRSLRSNNSNNY